MTSRPAGMHSVSQHQSAIGRQTIIRFWSQKDPRVRIHELQPVIRVTVYS